MRILIVASAPCVHADLREVEHKHFDAVIATSYMMRDCPRPIDYQCTLHARDFIEMPDRYSKALYYPGHLARRVSVEDIDTCDIVYDQVPFRNGSSGLYCVGFALLIGGTDIVLAGSPIDGPDHYYGGRPFKYVNYRPAWEVALPQMRGKVRSLSGWTKELLER